MGGLFSKSVGANMTSAPESDGRPAKRLRLAEAEFGNYDVFISHRGPDTKTGFVGFLYEALMGAGLNPFLDCKSIGRGQDSWECIEHAIQRTPLAVVIFSKGFTESEWCLRELHAILVCSSVKVIPVFYDVEPWELKYPEKGRLTAGFSKLEKRHAGTLIKEWRADLKKASTMFGWVRQVGEKRLEADLVREVVEMFCKLANKPLPLHVGDHVFGHKEVAENLIRTVVKKKVSVLGLWGIGGIGKSTLARVIFNQFRGRFDASCFVGDVTRKVEKNDVTSVQNDILKALCENQPMENVLDKSRGKVILEKRLSRKEILVVLDDVRDAEQMGSLMSVEMLKEGSLCIVTSRDRRVFQNSTSFPVNAKVCTHEVQALSDEDSQAVLACLVFGRDVDVPREFQALFGTVSKACGGVPLVLEVIGSRLRGEKDVEFWKEVLDMLDGGSIMDERKVLKVLRSSYDTLEKTHQEIFLDIACALLGTSVEGAKIVWRSQGWRPALGVRTLVEKALITVDKEGDLCMHDLLRDMGREISKSDSSSVGKRLRDTEFLALLKKEKPLPDILETLDIQGRPGIEVDLSSMKGLRILKKRSDFVALSSLPENLCWLGLGETSIKRLPESFENLRNLEVLDLSRCFQFMELPSSFAGLGNLKYLKLTRCRIKELPKSFGDLTKLEVLVLVRCIRLIGLPVSFGGLQNLKRLDLCKSGIKSLPKSFGMLHNLKYLNLEYTCIQSLPESFGELINLEALSLEGCQEIVKLPHSIGCILNLKSLNLRDSKVRSLPQSVGELINLEVLSLEGCQEIVELPHSIGCILNLKSLNLRDTKVHSLPESVGELINLEVLSLEGCQEIVELPLSVGCILNLKSLNLRDSKVHSLPKSCGGLINLEELDLLGCNQLEVLPRSM